jgi:hypothetical protein
MTVSQDGSQRAAKRLAKLSAACWEFLDRGLNNRSTGHGRDEE